MTHFKQYPEKMASTGNNRADAEAAAPSDLDVAPAPARAPGAALPHPAARRAERDAIVMQRLAMGETGDW